MAVLTTGGTAVGKVADGTDFYEVLGVPGDADAEQIQRAYRTLARRHHPDVDKSPGAEDRFKKINEAYTVLSDPKSRRKYDRFGAAWRQVPDDYERVGARAGGFGGPREYSSRAGGGIDVEDLLEGLFGQRSGRAHGYGPAPGADTEAEITISVEDAYHGSTT
jgi:curved DNA-binding protein